MSSHSNQRLSDRFTAATKIYYGWVIVAVSTLIIALSYGIMYSYSVFFKPILETFNWDRTTVSSIYSISLILRGAVSIAVGWLADRYGAAKLTAFCGVMVGLGLVLSGRVTTLWQFYLTYGLILSIGLSGSFIIGSAVTAQWFIRRRPLALAVVSTGSGMGTLIIVPLAERMIHAYSWSAVFVLFGLAAGALITINAFLLKPPPVGPSRDDGAERARSGPRIEKSLTQAALSTEMLLLVMIFSMLFFSSQMVMIHLVNHATDIGLASRQAAKLISVIGVVSIFGRLIMGSASGRIGTHNCLIICIALALGALCGLFFCRSLTHFYLFAVLFGFAYGGEVPLIPLFIGQNFGIRSMAALIGLLLFVGNIFGALGPLLGGRIFDRTGHYQYAFGLALAATCLALTTALVFKKKRPGPCAA